ncbi:MAG: molybdenum cofactor guanylyltransferase MobA [Pigmentiphaga sp.]
MAEITGLILAGGLSRRMGGTDKSLLEWQGRPLLDHVAQRLKPQVGSILINTNHPADAHRQAGTVVSDPADLPAAAGPLLGVATGLRASPTDWLLCVPCDSPWLPPDLAVRLCAALAGGTTDLAAAWAAGRRQGVFLLLHRRHLAALEAWLRQGERKVDLWLTAQGVVDVPFADPAAFANLNTPDDWRAAGHASQSANR